MALLERTEVSGLVLAGGRGTRMGGVDKGWVDHGGEPLIALVVRRFAPQVGPLLISANRNIDSYRTIGDVVTDGDLDLPLEAYSGPLVGVLAGLNRATTEWVAIVPCDAPALPLDLVARLTDAVTGAPVAYAVAAGRKQPAFAVVKRSTADNLRDFLLSGERALRRWYETIGAQEVEFADAAAFRNVNEPADAAVREDFGR